MAVYKAELAPAAAPPVVDLAEPITGQQLLDAMKKMGNNSISVKYDCSNFYGNESDKLAFKNWLSEFEGVLKTQTNWDEERKLGCCGGGSKESIFERGIYHGRVLASASK